MKKKMPVKIKIAIIAFAAVLLTVFIVFACDMRLCVVNYSVKSAKIHSGVRIVLITDLHSCKYGESEDELVSEIESAEPDLILFGGDICDDRIPHTETWALLDKIADKYPCFYVTGNHEYWSGEVDVITDKFKSYGVTVLEGTYSTVEVREEHINICGVSDPDITKYTDSSFGMQMQLEALRGVSDNGFYTVLLAHRPEFIETYSEYGFDLVLSGHAHGGQFRIPGVMNGFIAPGQGLFPKYAGGEYYVNGTEMIVSRGLARETYIIPRVFNRPELVVIDLNSTE